MPLKGYRPSQEHRAKIAAALRGRKHTSEHCVNLTAALRAPVVRAKISAAQRGEKHHGWKGGRIVVNEGYIRLLRPNHPHANHMGYVLEHRLVMEGHLGRTLLPEEVVHHVNGRVADNRMENLERFDSKSDHRRWHCENGDFGGVD